MATILDAKGKPVQVKALTEELAEPNYASVRTPWWPSTGALTAEKLAGILAAVDSNDALEYLTLAEEMEEKDMHYASVLHTRKLAVVKLGVCVEAPTEDAADIEIADFVSQCLKSRKVKSMLMDLMDALGKGYSVTEIMWNRNGKQWVPAEYKHRDPRFFMFDRYTGEELRLRDLEGTIDGLPLAPYKFIQHRPHIKTGLPIRGGLARLAVVGFMGKSYGIKDWLAFAEVFGMPIRVGKYDPAATAEQKLALLRAVAQIGSDAAATIPSTMEIEFIEAAKAGGGDKLFQVLCDWFDSQVSKAVLGQTMTADNGSSLSQAQVHNDVREDIRDSDAEQLAATIQEQLVRPLVDLNFGPREEHLYPCVKIEHSEPEDLKTFSEAVAPLIDRGLPVEVSTVLDKFGLPEPEEGAQLLTPAVKASPGFGGAPRPGPDGESAPAAPDQGAPLEEPQPKPDGESYRAKVYRQLTEAVLAGKTLTADQRRLLSTFAAEPQDEVDKLTHTSTATWRAQMDPVLDPIASLAASCETEEEFKRKLKELQLNSQAFMDAVATATFKARGLGAATDKAKV